MRAQRGLLSRQCCSAECSDATGLSKLPWELWAASPQPGAALLELCSPAAASLTLASAYLPCFTVCI